MKTLSYFSTKNFGLFLFMPLAVIVSTTQVWAEESCLSGNKENGNLVTQLNLAKAKSPITEIIYKQYKLKDPAKVEASTACLACTESEKLMDPPKQIQGLSNELNGAPNAPTLLFKSACLAASNTFDTGTNEIMCPNGEKLKSKNPSRDGLCINNEIMTYQNAVISSFLSCAKRSGLTTFSATSLYKMFSVESAFKPQYASRGGTGMSQLTGIFVDDIHQPWRGRKFLDKIAKSDLQECEAAKLIAQEDLNSKPKISDACSFIQTGKGFERNILYGLIGMANSWEKDIEPKLRSYLERNKGNPLTEEIKEVALINAYGHGGRVAARALVARLDGTTPEQFLASVKKPISFTRTLKNGKSSKVTLNGYSLGMNKRQDQIKAKLAEPIKSEYASKGASACINQ